MAIKKFRDLLPADAIPEFVQQIDDDEAARRTAAQADKIENTPYIVPANNGYNDTGTEDSSNKSRKDKAMSQSNNGKKKEPMLSKYWRDTDEPVDLTSHRSPTLDEMVVDFWEDFLYPIIGKEVDERTRVYNPPKESPDERFARDMEKNFANYKEKTGIDIPSMTVAVDALPFIGSGKVLNAFSPSTYFGTPTPGETPQKDDEKKTESAARQAAETAESKNEVLPEENPTGQEGEQSPEEAQARRINAWAKRRSEDVANLRADKIASQFGVDLWRNPQNYKTLRDEATSAIDEDGNYTQPAMRKSLGSADAYYDYIDKQNEQAIIEYIHDLAKNQAINDKKSASDEYGTYNLDDIYSGLSEERAALDAALASARSESDITAAEKAIAEWEKKVADADANYAEWKKGRDDALSSFDQKIADIDQTYRDLMGIGNADGTGVSDAPDSGGGGRTSPEEDNEAPSAVDAQGEEFYKWLATPSGQAFYDYWHNLGYDFDRENKGWSRMRTMNDADLWGNVYGYGDLSKYGVDDFAAPEGWADRLVNSGFDINSEDLVDQLMDYMFNTHALRRSDLLSEAPDWDRYGSLADQQEFIEYLFENGMMPYRSSVKDTVYKSGLDEKDIAQLYMASRLSQLGLDGYTVDEIVDLMNRSLGRAGDAYMLGLMDEGDEGNAFHSEDQRSNRMTYNPTMLFTDDLNQYSYSDAFRDNNDEYAGPYDLLDWNMLDTYYQLANDLAKEQGRKVGLATR